MREQLEKIREEALNQIEASEALEKLNEIRVAYLGKKGELTNLLKGMKNVAPEIGRASCRERVSKFV